MELILWRHGSANHYQRGQRALDPLGHRQAQASAAWLQQHYPRCTVWTSESLRAQETAAYYGRPLSIHGFLNPDLDEGAIFHEVRHSGESALLLVGHQMWIGALAAQLAHDRRLMFFAHSQVVAFAQHQGRWRLLQQFTPQQHAD